MSEYQYYEFQAIDRPLTEKEMGDCAHIRRVPALRRRASLTIIPGGDSRATNTHGWRSTLTPSSTWPTGERIFSSSVCRPACWI